MKETYTDYCERMVYGEDKATRYAKRKVSHLDEFALVDHAFTHIPKGHRVLDVPYGRGREVAG